MYRILIVEGDQAERKGIKILLEQMGTSCEISEAVNGQTALDMMADEEYDVLLTDIKMPFYNGIELINRVNALKRGVKCIVISECREFEYVRQAMRAGVADYILKPFKPIELENTISRVLNELDEIKKEKIIRNKCNEYVKEQLLRMALNGVEYAELEETTGGLVSLDFVNSYKRIMLLEFNEDSSVRKNILFKEYILKAEPAIEQYVDISRHRAALFFKEGNLPFIEIADEICSKVEADYQTKPYIAISDELYDFDGIAKAMSDLDFLMENKFYHLSENVFYQGMKRASMAIVQMDDDTLMKQMKQDIKVKNITGLRGHFDKFCDKYRSKTDFSQLYIKFLFSNLLKDFYENFPGADEKELNMEIDALYRANDFTVVIEIVNKNIDRLEKIFSENPVMIHKEIEVVKRYIYEHYGDELSVDLLGEMVYMTPSYLSSVFKKETGQNLSRFIKAYRMERAKDMLENTMAKIVDISATCGYPNVSYFCSSFREYYGVSPQKYRESGE